MILDYLGARQAQNSFELVDVNRHRERIDYPVPVVGRTRQGCGRWCFSGLIRICPNEPGPGVADARQQFIFEIP